MIESSNSENQLSREQLREKMFGTKQASQQFSEEDSVYEKIQSTHTNYCFGDIWNRPGLSYRDRSLITVAMLAVLNSKTELQLHVKGALANGVSPEEIRETLFHLHMYAGFPVALEGLRNAKYII